MNTFINYLNNHLSLYNYTLLRTSYNKAVIFKIQYKFTKCIYLSYVNNSIEISIDKIFDLKESSNYIERLIIGSKKFESMESSLNYIQKNLV